MLLLKFLYSFNVITMVCTQESSSVLKKVFPMKLCSEEESREQLGVSWSSPLCHFGSSWDL